MRNIMTENPPAYEKDSAPARTDRPLRRISEDSTPATRSAVQFYRNNPVCYDALFHSRPKGKRGNKEADTQDTLRPFLERHPDLCALDDDLNALNLFEALNVADYEVRHSNLLSWLLDPAESHGLGQRPFQFFRDLVDKKSTRRTRRTPPTVEVLREWKRIDVLVIDSANKECWVVENKTHAGEHGDQLRRYRELIATSYPDFRRHFVFLSPGETTASDPHYIALSYADIAAVIETLLRDLGGTPIHGTPDRVSLILRHYVDFVRPDLGSKERRLNIFKILQLREIKHSDFWSWLLNPRSNHQLGTRPLMELLRLAGLTPSTVRTDPKTLGHCEVIRERDGIDLLIVSREARLVVAIENKLEARESREQLQKYRSHVESWYPGYRKGLLYMSLSGDEPSDAKFQTLPLAAWLPFLGELTAGFKAPDQRQEMVTMLSHYRGLLLDRLSYLKSTVTVLPPRTSHRCQKLWDAHPGQLNLLLSTVKTWQRRIEEDLEGFIGETVQASFEGGCFRPSRFPGPYRVFQPFVPVAWKSIPPIWNGGMNPAFEGQLVCINFLNLPFTNPFQNAEPMGISLILGLNEAKHAYEPLREAIYKEAGKQRDLFNTADRRNGAKGRKDVRIGVHTLVSWDECRRLPLHLTKERFCESWKRFLEAQYPRFLSLLTASFVADYRPTR